MQYFRAKTIWLFASRLLFFKNSIQKSTMFPFLTGPSWGFLQHGYPYREKRLHFIISEVRNFGKMGFFGMRIPRGKDAKMLMSNTEKRTASMFIRRDCPDDEVDLVPEHNICIACGRLVADLIRIEGDGLDER